MAATSDLRDRLADVTAPTLVVTGEDDVWSSPQTAEFIAAAVRDGRAEIIPGAGDALLQEQPDAVAALITGFLRGRKIDRDGGMAVRRAVLGDIYVDRAMAHEDPISTEFQSFLTE